MGDEGEACLSLVAPDVEEVLSPSESRSGTGEAIGGKGGSLAGSLDKGLCACNIVCNGVSPVPSSPAIEVLLAEAPLSIELRLDVRL